MREIARRIRTAEVEWAEVWSITHADFSLWQTTCVGFMREIARTRGRRHTPGVRSLQAVADASATAAGRTVPLRDRGHGLDVVLGESMRPRIGRGVLAR